MCRSIRAPALTLYLHIYYNTLNRQRKKKRKVEINDTLLLTPYSYGNSNNINRKEDICIKEALFEFVLCRSKNLTCVEYTCVFTSG